jgi:hypothetical protein
MIGNLPRGRDVLGALIGAPRPLCLAYVGRHTRFYGFPLGHPPMRSFLACYTGVLATIGHPA